MDQVVLLLDRVSGLSRSRGGPDADWPEENSSRTKQAVTPPGWEFLSPTAAPRSSALVELLENPIVVWSERDMLASEAEKHWERLTEAHASAGEERPAPGEFYFSFAELEKATSAAHQVMIEELGMESGEETLRIRAVTRFAFRHIGHLIRELQPHQDAEPAP